MSTSTTIAYIIRKNSSGARVVRLPGAVPLYALHDGLVTQTGDCGFIAREVFKRSRGHVIESTRGDRFEFEDHGALADWLATEAEACGRIRPCKS